MRTAIAIAMLAVSATFLLTAPVAHAETIPQGAAEAAQLAKVYRDYPGYIAPVQCEPVAGQAPAAKGAKAASPSADTSCADRSGGHYLAIWAGGTVTEDADPGSNVDISFDSGFGGGLAVGYDFGPARLELEGSYRESDVDKVRTGAGSVKVNADLELLTVLVNGYVDFATDSIATPYLGIGAGYARAEVDDIDDEFVAGQLAAGVLFAISPAVSVDLGYRYLAPIGRDDLDIRQHTASVGLQFRF